MAFICKYLIPSSVQDLLNKIEAELVNMGWTIHDEYIPFTAGKNPAPSVGNTIEGVTSGATARIASILVTGGSWVGNNASGFFGIDTLVGKFASENVKNNTVPLNPAATINGDYFVIYKSNGELGDRIYEYISLKMTTSATNISITPFGWFNNATHIGSIGVSGVGAIMAYVAGYSLVISGTKDLVVTHRIGFTTHSLIFGHIPKRFYANPLATLTAGPSGTGVGVVLSLNNTTKFILNQTYWMFGSLGEGRDRIKVTAINPGVSITGDGLTIPFAAGAMIGAFPSMFAIYTGISFAATFDRVVGSGASTLVLTTSPFVIATTLDPDLSLGQSGAPLNTVGLYVLQPILFINSTVAPVGYSDAYVFNPPVNTFDTIYGITGDGLPLDTGTATDGSILTLTCAGKGWGINAYANKTVIIVSGTGAGYTRRIISNTADVLTIGVNWDTTPNITSIFYIVDEVYRVAGTDAMLLAYREYI